MDIKTSNNSENIMEDRRLTEQAMDKSIENPNLTSHRFMELFTTHSNQTFSRTSCPYSNT